MSNSDDYPEKDRPVQAWCDPDTLHVRLKDGREIANPLWWYPTLLQATPAQRNAVEFMWDGIHWPELDEDIAIEGMLQGHKARNAIDPEAVSEAAE